jgi:hypothetical protein
VGTPDEGYGITRAVPEEAVGKFAKVFTMVGENPSVEEEGPGPA